MKVSLFRFTVRSFLCCEMKGSYIFHQFLALKHWLLLLAEILCISIFCSVMLFVVWFFHYFPFFQPNFVVHCFVQIYLWVLKKQCTAKDNIAQNFSYCLRCFMFLIGIPGMQPPNSLVHSRSFFSRAFSCSSRWRGRSTWSTHSSER